MTEERSITAFCQECGEPLYEGQAIRWSNLRTFEHRKYGRVSYSGVVCERHNTVGAKERAQNRADLWRSALTGGKR